MGASACCSGRACAPAVPALLPNWEVGGGLGEASVGRAPRLWLGDPRGASGREGCRRRRARRRLARYSRWRRRPWGDLVRSHRALRPRVRSCGWPPRRRYATKLTVFPLSACACPVAGTRRWLFFDGQLPAGGWIFASAAAPCRAGRPPPRLPPAALARSRRRPASRGGGGGGGGCGARAGGTPGIDGGRAAPFLECRSGGGRRGGSAVSRAVGVRGLAAAAAAAMAPAGCGRRRVRGPGAMRGAAASRAAARDGSGSIPASVGSPRRRRQRWCRLR